MADLLLPKLDEGRPTARELLCSIGEEHAQHSIVLQECGPRGAHTIVTCSCGRTYLIKNTAYSKAALRNVPSKDGK